ncbi:MAG: hypothetical protein ACFCUR_12865 [Rhodomicrobiaceae bacterium]
MLKPFREDQAEHEKVLARGLKEVAAELRLVDAADLIAFIRTGRFGNVRSLVNASTEMYFKPGMMSFRQSGDVSFCWDGAPSIVLNMEFRHPAVDVFFQLVLEARQAGVEIEYISFTRQSDEPGEHTRLLAEAIANARFSPLAADRLDA